MVNSEAKVVALVRRLAMLLVAVVTWVLRLL